MMEMEDNGVSTSPAPFEIFLESVEKCGISLYWDIDEEWDPEDTITVELEDTLDCAIELDPYLEHMDIFMTFGYYDCSRWERENYDCTEEIEQDTYVKLQEKKFESFLVKHSHNEVSTWDDGCYMCPGYTARVGFQQCECSVEIIQNFLEIVKLYTNQYGTMDVELLQREVIGDIARAYGYSLKTLPFSLCPRNDAVFSKELLDRSPAIYIGIEHVLVYAAGRKSAITKRHWDMMLEIVNSVECNDDLSFLGDGKFLSVCSNSFFFQIPCQEGAEYTEELFLKKQLGLFLPFASDSLQQIISSLDSQLSINSPLIFTEGQTDWKHIKHSWQQMVLQGVEALQFCEYEKDIQMGNGELMNMCRAFSKMNNPAPRIMLFDRDDPAINKQAMLNGQFKDWGNHVYSLILPVPPHRKATPNICIEHFYTDAEIKTERLVDGVHRRLFMGNEFDCLGRAPQLNKLCHQTRLCGPEKISIIDNGVYDFSESEKINYALSKAGFVELMSRHRISKEAELAFVGLYEAIKAVLQFDHDKFKPTRKQ